MGSPQQYILGSEMKWTLCLLFVASVATALPTRDKKAFSLFSVVTFPNKECTSQMTPPMNGICVTADECQNAGDVVATKSGNCASGFGVCCLRTVEGNPGATITTALTYIQSPDFPAAVTALNNAATPPTAINRAFNIQGGANVCQVRFDFITGVVTAPDAADVAGPPQTHTGDCTSDVISVTTPARGANTAGIGIPALCGTLTGQHLYVDVNSLTGGAMAATLNINTAAVAGACGVTLVEANSPAPGGAAVVPDSFSLATMGDAAKSGVGAQCTQSYLEVVTPQTQNTATNPRLCGAILNAADNQVTAAPVDTVGFTIGVVSDGFTPGSAAATGFDLLYTQRGCP